MWIVVITNLESLFNYFFAFSCLLYLEELTNDNFNHEIIRRNKVKDNLFGNKRIDNKINHSMSKTGAKLRKRMKNKFNSTDSSGKRRLVLLPPYDENFAPK